MMIYDQPQGDYVRDAYTDLDSGAPWPKVWRRAWQLQKAAEAAEEYEFQRSMLARQAERAEAESASRHARSDALIAGLQAKVDGITQ